MTPEEISERIFIIRDLETLKVMTDPLRSQIYEVLVHEALSIKEVAERLGHTASKLYYHVNMLEKHGLIDAVESRVVANLIEKVYRARAAALEIDRDLFSFSAPGGPENIAATFTGHLDTTREDMIRSLQARTLELEQGTPSQPRQFVISRQVIPVAEEVADEFRERLIALIKEYENQTPSGSEAGLLQKYALTIAFYPSFYYPGEQER